MRGREAEMQVVRDPHMNGLPVPHHRRSHKSKCNRAVQRPKHPSTVQLYPGSYRKLVMLMLMEYAQASTVPPRPGIGARNSLAVVRVRSVSSLQISMGAE